MRHSLLLGFYLAIVLCVLTPCHANFFYVEKKRHRCFYLDLPKKTSFRAEYESPDSTDVMRTVIAIYAPNRDPDQENRLVKKEQTKSKGSISYTTDMNGEHWVCVNIDVTDYAIPDNTRMRFTLKLEMGTSVQEYADLAKRSHLDELQLQLLKIRDRIRLFQSSQTYAKEKSQVFQEKIESNNNRIMWVSVIQIFILLVSGIYQAHHLRKFFHKKKLV